MRRDARRAKRMLAGAIVATLALQFACPARAGDVAQSSTTRTFSSGYRFVEMSGEELYVNVCRGCHMDDAKGAAGSGVYPSLAFDRNLEASSYAVDIVVNGRRAMPSFADMMSDDQIAAVVNYLRTHFGNGYQDAVTAKDVQASRR